MSIKKKFIIVLVTLMLVSIVFSSCNVKEKPEDNDVTNPISSKNSELSSEEDETSAVYPITLTDHAGRKVIIEKKVEKIVSGYYIPSYTLIAMGLQDMVVGIENKPETRPFYEKFAPEMGKKPQIGTRKEVNIEEIVSLEPDLVILPDSLEDSANQLESMGINAFIVNPENIENYFEMVTMIAAATDTKDRANELMDFYNNKINELNEKTAKISDVEGKTALITSSSSPLRVASNSMFQIDVLNNSKINNIANDMDGNHWADVSIEQIVVYNPEYIFVSSMPEFNISEILENKQWSEVEAVKQGNVFIIPSNIDSWDSPSMASVCASFWMVSKAYPDVVNKEEVEEIVKEYYKLFFNYEISLEEMGL